MSRFPLLGKSCPRKWMLLVQQARELTKMQVKSLHLYPEAAALPETLFPGLSSLALSSGMPLAG